MKKRKRIFSYTYAMRTEKKHTRFLNIISVYDANLAPFRHSTIIAGVASITAEQFRIKLNGKGASYHAPLDFSVNSALAPLLSSAIHGPVKHGKKMVL